MMEHRVEHAQIGPGFDLKAFLDRHEEEGYEIVAILIVMGKSSILDTAPPVPVYQVISRRPKSAIEGEDTVGAPSLTEANALLQQG